LSYSYYAIKDFKEKAEILICTEAGGEGRNLQFANILFNYDLPWSPLKIEQRIGRIHRFGQKKDVYIFNFASKDTVAERILEVLNHKIRFFAGP
jgi:SNF2 family DNA or RNA helicase